MLHKLILTGHVSGSMSDPEAEMVELEQLFSQQKIKHLLKSNLKANLLGARIQGALVRDMLDTPSSFFFSSDRNSGQRKLIHSLLSDMEELTDPGQIRKREMEFYTSLYKNEYKDKEDIFCVFSQGLPRVTKETNHRLKHSDGTGALRRGTSTILKTGAQCCYSAQTIRSSHKPWPSS